MPSNWPCSTPTASTFGEPLSAVTRLLAPDLYEPRDAGALQRRHHVGAGAARLRFAAWKMWVYGFRQVKVKVGIAGQDDVDRLGAIRRRVGRKMDLRIDANEAWTPDEARRAHPAS